MTERLYYLDAALRDFTATIVAHDEDPTRAVLDRTAFYPTSGGQPHDLGTINGVPVLDVIDRGDDIVHVLAAPISLGAVEGTVDAHRRDDYTVQHTAQHLLSALAADQHGWETTSVHFGADHSTIELASSTVDTSALAGLEVAANVLITAGRRVLVSFEMAAEAMTRGLRKPSDRSGTLRIVTIDGIDRSACGGTHVADLGAIGALVLDGVERVRGNTRIAFLAGARVRERYHADRDRLDALAGTMNCAVDELATILAARQEELAASRRRAGALEADVATLRVGEWYRATAPDAEGIVRMFHQGADEAPTLLRAMAQRVAVLERATLLLVDRGTRTIHFAASADSGVDAGARLKAILAVTGGRGGGSPGAAQGSVPDDERLHEIISLLQR